MQEWVVSLSATLNTTCLFPTNCIGLIAELSAEMSQAQHAGTQTLNHIPASGNRELLEYTTICLAVWNHISTPWHPARKWLSSISTSLLSTRLLLLTSGLLLLLLLSTGLLVLLLRLTGLTLGKIGVGLLFPTPPLTISLSSLPAHWPSPDSI